MHLPLIRLPIALNLLADSKLCAGMDVPNALLQELFVLGPSSVRGTYQSPPQASRSTWIAYHTLSSAPALPSLIIFVHPSLTVACCLGSIHTNLSSPRGPAKGYIEGLEHRLHEAETLLLQLLPVVSLDQLNTATSNLLAEPGNRDSPDRLNRSSPPVLNKKTGIEYWETFPLDTVENIRRWQQDCALHSQFRDHDSHESSRGASRPGSVDLQRDTSAAVAPAVPMPRVGTGASVISTRPTSNMTQYRSMSNDSYTTKQEYMTTPVTTAAQTWNGNAAYAQAYSNAQPWQTGMQHAHPHQQPQMIAAGGPMDVDSSFFSSDQRRHLFW